MSTLLLLLCFSLGMIALSFFGRSSKLNSSIEEFLVSSRDLSTLRGAFSIAISWAWAPAIFIAGLQAYTKGLAGAFWFIAPNILCFFLFAFVAYKLRNKFPNGFTLPQFIKSRFKTKRTHTAFLIIFFGYQLGAIIINAVAGGTLLNLLTGMNYQLAVGAISLTALIYSVIGGMRASVRTDVIQLIIVLGLAVILVPWVIINAGGMSAISGGLGGIDGLGANIFDPKIAWAFGIPMTISLLSGPIGDQQFFQRAFSVKKDKVIPTFVIGGIIFGLIPIILSLLGFIAANPSFGIEVADPQMVTPTVMAQFLPSGVLVLFTLMAFAGLCSTIDSAFCAISSFVVADITDEDEAQSVRIKKARIGMILMGVLGIGISLLQPKLIWIFFLYFALSSIGFFPTLFSIFSERYTEKAAFWSVIIGLIGAFPLALYANIGEDVDLRVLSSVLSIAIGGIVSLCFVLRNKS